MNKKSKGRRILSCATTAIIYGLIFFCLGDLLLCYLYLVPPKLSDILIFSPPPPKVLDFSKIDEIIINDNWAGFSAISSYENHYILKNDLGQFKGEANFSVGMFDPIHANAPLAISIDEVKTFTDLLAQSKLERGIYIANINHSDDYPNIEIILKSDNKEVACFSSVSQEETHAPWKISINGNLYIVQSDFPGRALNELKKKLRQDVFESLIDQYEQ